MEFRTSNSRKEVWSVGAIVGIKFVITLCMFWVYEVLQGVSLGFFLFGFKACSAVILILWQKPFSRGSRLTRQQWLWIIQVSFVSLVCSAMWLTGLRLCGALRTTLLWDHSDIAILAVLNSILSCGSHSKSRGAILFILGTIALLLFDNDQVNISTVEHPEGIHNSIIVHIFFWFLSFIGVPDHKGGVVLLIAGVLLSLAQRSSQKRVAVEIGGSKRLQSFVTIIHSILLLPWGMVNLFSSNTPWSSLLPCLIIFSLLSVLSFYIDSFGGQHIDACHVALLSSLIPFVTALGTSCLLVYYTKDSIDIHHGLSMGVVLAFILLFLATLFLTQSVRQSHGVLVGYSAAGLPLYSSQHHTSPARPNWFKPVLSQIMENSDSRRIFYFLILNLIFTGIEMLYGIWTNSLGLISDGFHMLFDCTALFFGLYAAVMTHWKPTRVFSFGYGRVEILSGFVNGLFLIVIACCILTEALGRLVDPPHINTDKLLFVSVVGFIVNLIGIFAFHTHGHNHSHSHSNHTHKHIDHTHKHSHSHDHEHSLKNTNMQGIFLHILADTMGSVGVIISSILIEQLGWLIADPICSLFISILIIISVIPLLKSCASSLMLSTPNHTNVKEAIDKLPLLDGVLSHTDSHFWQQGDQIVGTVHTQVAPSASEQKVAHMVGQFLRDRGLMLLTVQVEKPSFISNDLRVSYVQQTHNTSPQVYVDYGPHTGEIKSV